MPHELHQWIHERFAGKQIVDSLIECVVAAHECLSLAPDALALR
jgi:hypothetical protein